MSSRLARVTTPTDTCLMVKALIHLIFAIVIASFFIIFYLDEVQDFFATYIPSYFGRILGVGILFLTIVFIVDIGLSNFKNLERCK